MINTTPNVKFRCNNLSDACTVVEFLANEACWFEFLPDDHDTYVIAVQPHIESAVTNLIVKHGLAVVYM